MREQRFEIAALGSLGTLVVAGLSAFSAAAADRECGGDGSFRADDPLAQPSDFCLATDLPGWPESLPAALLLAALFVLPTVVVVVGALWARRRSQRQVGWGAILIGAAMALTSALIVIATAGIDYGGAA